MSSESKEKDSSDKSTGMVWDIIDLDTLSVGRSTPAFADSFSKDGTALTTEENPSSNNKSFENSNIGSRLLSSLLNSKKLISTPKESLINPREEAVEGNVFGQDSPILSDSIKTNCNEEENGDGETKSYQSDSKYGASEADLSSDPSPSGFIVVDDREINSSTPISSFAFVNNESVFEVADAATVSSHSGDYSDLHDTQTPVLVDFDGDTENQGEFIHLNTPNSDISLHYSPETANESHKAEDDDKSVSSTKDNRTSWEIYQEQLQLAREALKESNKNGRNRSSSADEESAIFGFGIKPSNNKKDCSLKEECRDSIDFEKGTFFSFFDYPSNALLKVKEIFFVFALGNALYDQKSPVPIIVSHALAFLVGAFVGRKLSLSLGNPSSGGSSIQNYLTTNSTNRCSQRNDVPAIFA